MNSTLDTQESVTSQPVKDTQGTNAADKAQSKKTQVEKKPLKELKFQVSSFPASTIELTNSEEEDEILSAIPVAEEDGNGNNLQNFMNVFSGSNGRYSSALP